MLNMLNSRLSFEDNACLEILKEMRKDGLTVEEISSYLSVNKSSVSRYLNEDVVPSKKQRERILNLAEKIGITPEKLVRSYMQLKRTSSNQLVLSLGALLSNSRKLLLSLFLFFRRHPELADVDGVITVETEGIPIGVTTSLLLDVPVLYARRHRTLAWKNPIPIILERSNSIITETLFLDEHELSKINRAIVVDDVVRTGTTLLALNKTLGDLGVETNAIMALASLRREFDWPYPPTRGFHPIMVVG